MGLRGELIGVPPIAVCPPDPYIETSIGNGGTRSPDSRFRPMETGRQGPGAVTDAIGGTSLPLPMETGGQGPCGDHLPRVTTTQWVTGPVNGPDCEAGERSGFPCSRGVLGHGSSHAPSAMRCRDQRLFTYYACICIA